MTCVVAAFIIIATAGVFYYNPSNPNSATLAADTAANHITTGAWSKVAAS